jgi:putative spermidine/putrescine transport system ATP-binding protein
LRGLRKKYAHETVVDDVELDIRPGEFFSLLGPSGSGKTTTLMMIAGFTAADGGQVLVDGGDISAMPPQLRGFGMIFQNYAIFPHLNVFENVAFPLRARRMPNAEIAERVAWALALVRLESFAGRYSRQLSGGQQQRVAIARAVVFHPEVVLMDEPLSALDRNLRTAMQGELRDIQQRLGTTVIYVTHDQEEAMSLSDRIAIMNRGRIEQVGAPRDVYEQPANSFCARFLGEANLLRGVVDSVHDGHATLRTNGGALLHGRAQPGISVGNSAALFFRPERVTVGSATDGGNALRGCVRRAAFLGSALRCTVAADGGEEVILDWPNDGRAAAPAAGETVELAWQPADSLVLPA